MMLNFHSKKEKQTKFTSHELVSPARRHNILFRQCPQEGCIKPTQPGPVN